MELSFSKMKDSSLPNHIEKVCKISQHTGMKMSAYTSCIDDLPGNVVDNILMRIPFREAVRTSILSSSWRSKWITIPELRINARDVLCFRGSCIEGYKKFLLILEQILQTHRGQILKFSLHSSHHKSISSGIDQTIIFLSSHHINELSLVLPGEPYKVPPTLFSFQELTSLELSHCFIELPSSFKGFRSLKILELCVTEITDTDFESLTSKCPLLEKLKLEYMRVLLLNFNIPSLKWLRIYHGTFRELSFANKTCPAYICLKLYDFNAHHHFKQGIFDLVKFLGSIPAIETFKVTHFPMQLFSRGSIPSWLPVDIDRLKKLSVSVNFEDMKVLLTIMSLLRSSPNLQDLKIDVLLIKHAVLIPVHNSSELMNEFDYFLNNLQTVGLRFISSSKLELQFIKFLLRNSPMLKKMTISQRKGMDMSDLWKELLLVDRASPKSEIMLFDIHDNGDMQVTHSTHKPQNN